MEEGGIYRNFVTVRQQSRGWNRKAGTWIGTETAEQTITFTLA